MVLSLFQYFQFKIWRSGCSQVAVVYCGEVFETFRDFGQYNQKRFYEIFIYIENKFSIKLLLMLLDVILKY